MASKLNELNNKMIGNIYNAQMQHITLHWPIYQSICAHDLLCVSFACFVRLVFVFYLVRLYTQIVKVKYDTLAF